jgi:hypothetical protein
MFVGVSVGSFARSALAAHKGSSYRIWRAGGGSMNGKRWMMVSSYVVALGVGLGVGAVAFKSSPPRPAAVCAGRIDLAMQPAIVKYGDEAMLAGHLSLAHASGGRRVTVEWSSAAGTTLGTRNLVTSDLGDFTTTLPLRETTTFVARYTSGCTLSSARQVVQLQPLVTLDAPMTMTFGVPVTIHGTVRPNFSGTPITIFGQSLVGGVFTQIAALTSIDASTSAFTARVTLPRKGEWIVNAFVGKTAIHGYASSAYLHLLVR